MQSEARYTEPFVLNLHLALLCSSPSLRVMDSHFHLRYGQRRHPVNTESKESTMPNPLFGDGPIMLVKSNEPASEPLQMMKSPLSTAEVMSEAILSEDGNRASSSDMV